MPLHRRDLLTAGAAATGLMTLIGVPGQAIADPIPSRPATPTPGRPGDFDFLSGEWRIHHRRLTAPNTWVEDMGEATCRSIIGGVGHTEDLRTPARNFRGMGLRLLDMQTRVWSDYWVNMQSGVLGAAGLTGSFENDAGVFMADDDSTTPPTKGAGIWDLITPTSHRWRNAISRDGGRTWEETWIMHWTRVGGRPGD